MCRKVPQTLKKHARCMNAIMIIMLVYHLTSVCLTFFSFFLGGWERSRCLLWSWRYFFWWTLVTWPPGLKLPTISSHRFGDFRNLSPNFLFGWASNDFWSFGWMFFFLKKFSQTSRLSSVLFVIPGFLLWKIPMRLSMEFSGSCMRCAVAKEAVQHKL